MSAWVLIAETFGYPESGKIVREPKIGFEGLLFAGLF